MEIGRVGGDLVLLDGDVGGGDSSFAAVAEDDGGEEEAAEAEGAEVAGVVRVAADAGEVLGGGVVLPDAAAGGGVPEGEEGGAVEGDEEPGVGEDPAEVLDAGPDAGSGCVGGVGGGGI